MDRIATPDRRGPVAVIDDDGFIRRVLPMLLVAEGYDVVIGSSVEEVASALERAGKPPWAVIADYWLERGITGIDAIECMRSLFGIRFHAIILTGDTSSDRIDDAQEHGVQLLLKPVTAERLRAALEPQPGAAAGPRTAEGRNHGAP
jgi:DNA-binding NtrC family response regulator